MPTPINVALNKPATASNYFKPFAPSKAVDGTTTALSRWEANFQPGQSAWIYVDLGVTTWIKRYVVRHLAAVGFAPNYVMSYFVFQGSNTANINDWITLDTVSGNSASVTDRTIPPANFRYYRIATSTGLAVNPRLAGIVSFEIYPATMLTGLAASNGTLTPNFNSAVTNYTLNLPFDPATITTTSTPISIQPQATTITVTPTAQYSSYVITVNGSTVVSGQPSQPINVNVGNNPITVVVTNPASGDSTTYNVNALRSSNPYLQGAVLPFAAFMTPKPFNPATYNYTATYSSTPTVTIKPTAADSNATITISNNGTGTQTVVSGALSNPITLVQGLNNIVIVVKSKTGTDQKQYNFAVTKP